MAITVIAPHINCLVYELFDIGHTPNLDEAIAAGYKEIYIVTPKGVFKHQTLRPGLDGKQRYIRMPTETVPGVTLPKFLDMKPEIDFLPAGKIPVRLLEEVKAFFKAVIAKRGSAVEAMIWILWNQTAGYHLFVPNQWVGGASARYEWDSVPKESSIIVDIHSHADFGAFFSGTDNADDSGSIRFSGVIGHNKSEKQSMCWRFNCQSKSVDVKFEDLFEIPPTLEQYVPEAWLDKVQAPTYGGSGAGSFSSNGNVYSHNKGSFQGAHGSYTGPNGAVGKQAGEESDRVWKGSQHAKLHHGPWANKGVDTSPTQAQLQAGLVSGEIADDSAEANEFFGGGPVESTGAGTSRLSRRQLKKLEKQGKKKDIQESTEGSRPGRSLIVGQDGETLDPGSEEAGDARAERMVQEYFASLRNEVGGTEEEGSLNGATFSALACDYGPDAAAIAVEVSTKLDELQGSDDLLMGVSRKAFTLLSPEEKLDTFRALYQELGASDREQLATNGL